MWVGRFGLFLLGFVIASTSFNNQSNAAAAEGLEGYLQNSDSAFSWRVVEKDSSRGNVLVRVQMTSQQWRGTNWIHELLLVRPKNVRNADIGFLLISGSEGAASHLETLKLLAERAGAVAAVLSDVPNQPSFGLVEDALIAHTFDQFVHTGDATWPVIFPMVKSAVRGLDAVQVVARKEFGQKVERFVVAGASKRGWTTWLTAATDKRVVGIAPMVFDMLNMKVQTAWSEKVYGRQSEMIHDYTDAELVQRDEHPRLKTLREWVDPYSYRNRYTMPKLILLGTNDRYWTVDSLRHYWHDLPEPKLIYQTPNGGHSLGDAKDAINTLAAFYEMIAERQTLPMMTWTMSENSKGGAQIRVSIDQSAEEARLWTAQSKDRDFRDEHWTAKAVPVIAGAQAQANVELPQRGYRAFLVEAELKTPSGHPYKISTEARVIPEMP